MDHSEYIPLHLSGGGLGVFANKWNLSEFLEMFSGLVFSKQVFLLFSLVPKKWPSFQAIYVGISSITKCIKLKSLGSNLKIIAVRKHSTGSGA